MSLKDIADLVGTSPSTVSRVLNQRSPGCASKELQERIWAAAQETGYRPNEAARALRGMGQPEKPSAAPRVCVVTARFRAVDADPFFKDLLHCLETELYSQGDLLECVLPAEEVTDDVLGGVNGIIVLGRCSQSLLDRLHKRSRNIVGVWRNPMEFNVDEVVCDGKKAAELAMDHLVSLGHRSIAYIGDCSYEQRYVGYCSTLIRYDIPLDYSLIRSTDQTYAQGREAMAKLLESGSDFTAVFCANDITAVGVLEVLKERRRDLARNISVISIDDVEGLWDREPYLTTVHIPRQEMAHMAVTLLLDRIHRRHQEAVRIEFPCRIIRRDSCAPPAPRKK